MEKKNFWFFEPASINENIRIGLFVKKKLFSKKTPFQKIDIFDSTACGKILVIDGLIQVTQADEFIYHEMISHLPLLAHPDPKKILIIGGGDGGVLREILKHPVDEVIMVEIDEAVIDACKKIIPEISQDAFKNRRAKIVIGDGFEFLKKNSDLFDLIVVDSCDPHGPAKKLFDQKFYQNVRASLREDGIAIYQSGLAFSQEEVKRVFRINCGVFPVVEIFLAAIPSYGSGPFTFTIASKNYVPSKVNSDELQKKIGRIGLKTRYYNPYIHQASFVLPNFIKEYL
jgi:spermidine synthase